MYTENYIDINELEAELANAEVMPDLKRLYLCDRLMVETDPHQLKMLQALLDGYDKGMIDIRFDPWDGTVKYRAGALN